MSESPVSLSYGGVPGFVIFWILFFVAVGFFLQRLYFLFRLMKLGGPENRYDNKLKRLKAMLFEVVPQWCNLKSVARKDLAGIGHALLFWGFSFYLLSYIIFIGLAGGFGVSVIEGSAFQTVYFSILDIAGIMVVAAIIWAAIRRYIVRPKRLEPSMEAGIIMITVFLLMVLNVGIEGFGYAASNTHATWPLLGASLANGLSGAGISQGTLETFYNVLWWLHYAVILGFMIYIPRSKHLHILMSPVNIYFKSLGPKVVLDPIPMEAETFGVARYQDYKWKDMLDLYSCAVCGRCHDICPANQTGKTLSPREVILKLKEHLLETGPELLAGKAETATEGATHTLAPDVISEQELWACTTCGACQEVCPVDIEHVRKIIGLRRNLVLAQSKMPDSTQLMLKNMQSRGHPWTGVGSMRLRSDWTNEVKVNVIPEGSTEPVDTLLWVGCAGALVDRNVVSNLSLVRVLNKAGVNFSVLGGAEACCGDPARRVGYEFQFQVMAEQNIEVFKSLNVKRIITTCPHCFNTLKNEYSKFGTVNYEVVHHTELIADLIKQGKIKLNKEMNSVLTYHDPCYLGRYNNVYDEPRDILHAIPGAKLKEMGPSRNLSFCCGGGGGLMWAEEQPGTKKINEKRVEDVLQTKAETVVTACPYCLQMMEESIDRKGVKDTLKAKDLVEIVESAIKTD